MYDLGDEASNQCWTESRKAVKCDSEYLKVTTKNMRAIHNAVESQTSYRIDGHMAVSLACFYCINSMF